MKYLNPFYYAFSLYDFVRERKYWHLVKSIPTKAQKTKAASVRCKDKIRVAFIVYDITKWRSENLYRHMLSHPRFEPVIVLVAHYPVHADYVETMRIFDNTVEAIKLKGYKYVTGKRNIDISSLVGPDIVFYGEAYEGIFDSTYAMNSEREPLACYVPYSMHNTKYVSINNLRPLNLAWMTFVENHQCYEDLKALLDNRASNIIVTGLPLEDDFIAPDEIHDIWKEQSGNKKRIIWAPSHTIKGVTNVYYQSTFVEIADDMLALAEKFSDSVQWAFKPHPSLKAKLIAVWGEKKTNEYYEKWANMNNGQLEEGQFNDLFLTSDAMIHDCQSFSVEYLLTGKPVMYLENGETTSDMLNTQTKRAKEVHYQGSKICDIEKFIIEIVLGDNDYMKQCRLDYRKEYLTPPHGKSAAQNIINAILAEEEFSYLM